jgi:hypothetical protein
MHPFLIHKNLLTTIFNFLDVLPVAGLYATTKVRGYQNRNCEQSSLNPFSNIPLIHSDSKPLTSEIKKSVRILFNIIERIFLL